MSRLKSALVYLGGAAVVTLTAGGVALIADTRSSVAHAEAIARETLVKAGPRVRVAPVALSPAERRVELQGEARPFASVTLYAKVSGYLKDIRVDKGDRVKRDQVVAVIESPELDRQYDAAVADARYKRANATRSKSLAGPGVVSAREADSDGSQADIADATVASLLTQKSYETIRAPFSGMVTARFADPGALVQNAANAQTSAQPLVTISSPERLRVYIYVDQREAAFVRVGDPAEVTLADRPAEKHPGKVTRLSSELDPKTRTMLVEVDLDNRDGAIVPGSFVSVSLVVKTPPVVEVPVEALVLRGKDPFVIVVAEDNHVKFRPVVLAGDDGAHARVHSGLVAGERVALNLGENVVDGDPIQPLEQAPPPALPQAAAPGAQGTQARAKN